MSVKELYKTTAIATGGLMEALASNPPIVDILIFLQPNSEEISNSLIAAA